MLRTNTSEVTSAQFTKSRQNLAAVVKQYNGQLDTNKGSMISQLLLRPLAYVYSYIQRLIDSFIQDTSIAKLSSSGDAITEVADAVASNYFVQRRSGMRATVSVYMTASSSTVVIRPTSSFSIAGTLFAVPKTLICTTSPQQSTATIQYTKLYPIGSSYYAIVPMVALQPGYIQLLKQSPITSNSIIAGLQGMQLLSDVAAGGQQQTDAQLLQRARQSVQAKATGTNASITQRLKQAQLGIISANSTAPLYGTNRCNYNTACIAASSTIDTFVKTSGIAQRAIVPCTAVQQDGQSVLILDANTQPLYAGLYNIQRVATAQGSLLQSFTVTYSSTQQSVPTRSARLSSLQCAIIKSEELIQGADYNVELLYMPNILALQRYIQADDISFIGQSILIRAAIPVDIRVTVGVHASYELTQEDKAQLRTTIAKYICSYPVGTTLVSLDELRNFVSAAFPGIQLKLPCTWTASILTTQQQHYTFSTVSGILDLTQHTDIYKWDSLGVFLQCTSQDVILQVN